MVDAPHLLAVTNRLIGRRCTSDEGIGCTGGQLRDTAKGGEASARDNERLAGDAAPNGPHRLVGESEANPRVGWLGSPTKQSSCQQRH